MAKIGKIKLVNSREDENVAVEISSRPVEQGAPISDHVQQQNRTLRVSGYLIGSSAERDYRDLSRWARSGKIITYRGRVNFKDVLISNVTRGYEDIKNGMEISLSITTVRRAKRSWVRRPSNAGRQQATPSKTTGTFVTVKAGNTYWGWSQSYGTSIAQLRTWNGWPDRLIPIGARARVK